MLLLSIVVNRKMDGLTEWNKGLEPVANFA